jgi:hypothetical protein
MAWEEGRIVSALDTGELAYSTVVNSLLGSVW